MKTNLVLHCGARSVDRTRLSQIVCPPPTDTWHPISHIHLVNEVERSLKASNMVIVNEAFGLTEDNQRMFGLLQVSDGNEMADHAYVIGLRGATDKSLSRGLAVGSNVFVCDNMAFSAEIVMSRRQTKNILEDLPLMVDAAIGQLSARWKDQGKRIEAYKQTAIGNRDAAHLLMEMAGDVFPSQKLTDIYQEFKTPRHAEFGKENLWSMFNAVTEYLKPRAESKATSLWTMPSRTSRLHKVCDDFASLVIDVESTVTPVAPLVPVNGVN
jgi:hypothetical protein